MLKVNICLTDLLNCANIFTLLSSLVKVLQRDYTDLNKTHLQQCLRVENMESNIKKQEKLLTSKDEENAALEKVLLWVLGVAGVSMMVTGVMVLTPGNNSGKMEANTRASGRQEDVCLTPECAVAGELICQQLL